MVHKMRSLQLCSHHACQYRYWYQCDAKSREKKTWSCTSEWAVVLRL